MKTYKFLLSCVLLLAGNLSIMAQLGGWENCFYAEAGSNEVRCVVAFSSKKKLVWINTSVSTKYVKGKLSESEDYFENEEWTVDGTTTRFYLSNHTACHKFDYCPEISTSNRVVYRCKFYKYGPQPFPPCDIYGNWRPRDILPDDWCYIAFSNDKSSFIMWREPLNNYDGKVYGKTEFVRIPKADLLPKSVNYDFLED